MKTMRVLIADDEPLARKGIRQLLSGHADLEVAGEARHGSEAVHLMNALAPDLVFLDVQMPELDGFGVLKALEPSRLPLVIFVTAYDSFAVRAFERNALDYLVKPVHEARFDAALQRARERLHSQQELEHARALLQRAAADRVDADRVQRIIVATATGELVLAASEIDWIEADDYYAAIHVRGRRHLIRESLASLEERLDRSRFARVHRSAIVNLARVRELRLPGGDASLVLRDGAQIPVSRRRREHVVDALRHFAG
jgi:two-component system, LytTR family, response regulator